MPLASPNESASGRLYEGRVYSPGESIELMDMICPSSSDSFLDIGCGCGGTAKALRTRFQSAHLAGITISAAESETAKEFLDEIHVTDIQNGKFQPSRQFDGIILSHVLEHLVNPAEVLTSIRTWLTPRGFLYVALPNVAFYRQRLRFLLGEFNYTNGGPMDDTHLRFYTYDTARTLVERAGFSIDTQRATGIVPLGPLRNAIPRACRKLDRKITDLCPNLFGWQTLIRANRNR